MKAPLKALSLTIMLAAFAAAQSPAGYVESYIVKVKPEKRVEFDGVAKKIAEANRKYKGDNWLAYATEYGEQHTVMFSSVRESYGSIDKGAGAFMNAMKEGYGPAFMKLFQEMDGCITGSRGEVRRRRQDLSWNIPGDASAVSKHVGESKWLRVLTVRVRAGKTGDYEEIVKSIKSAFEKGSTRTPTFVSQSLVGQPAGTFYFSTFWKSLGDMDAQPGAQGLRDLLGSHGYDRYQKAVAEDTFTSEYMIARIVPELSNPTQEIASASPDFWTPKATAAPKPKSKAAPAKTGD